MKVKRNEPCPCGSGKKYKQCHGKVAIDRDNSIPLNAEDIRLYKNLGLHQQTIRSFYSKDIIAFFKIQDEGASADESKALQHALYLFVQFIENERLSSWQDFDRGAWEKLLVFSYLDLAYEQNQEQAKFFYKFICAFAKWLRGTDDTLSRFADWIKEIEQRYAEAFLGAVRVLELYRRQEEVSFLHGYEDVRRDALLQELGATHISEGVFEVIGMMDNWMTFKSLLTKNVFNVQLSKLALPHVEIGTTFIGVIKQSQPGAWDILALDRVFPSKGKPYLYKAIGVQV